MASGVHKMPSHGKNGFILTAVTSVATVALLAVAFHQNRELAIAPNRLEQVFVAQKPNRVWLTDFTYIHTLEGFKKLEIRVCLKYRLHKEFQKTRAAKNQIVVFVAGVRCLDGKQAQRSSLALQSRTSVLVETYNALVVCSLSSDLV
jgi:hypothetical protein